MAAGGALLTRVDSALNDIFAGWSLSTTVIATFFLLFLAYPWLTWRDPDTHPFLLARQATASPVRQPGESAVYRSIEVPYGYPLRSGLNIKDPGAPKWSSGRNGDLRDIWIQAMRGPLKDDGSPAGSTSRLLTVLGREQVIQRSVENMNLEISVIGNYLREAKYKRVAICLSNSVELLTGIFAASFYGVHPVLIPYDTSTEILAQYLHKIQPDVLIAEAGSLDVQPILSGCPNLSRVIWVTKPGNEHMDFAETSEDVGAEVKTSVWHDLIEEHKWAAKSEFPSTEEGSPSPSLSIIESSGDSASVVEYTSENIVAAVAALINALPRNQRICVDDIVLSIAPLTAPYPLMLTFVALFSHATVVLNSVAGESVDFALAVSKVSPTIVIAASQTTINYHDRLMESQQGPLAKFSHYWQNKSLISGNMPQIPSFAPPGARQDVLSQLRILFVYHDSTDNDSPCLSSTVLRDLRILLGARVCYALTASGVAGAVCQTNIFDYRPTKARQSHFGPPLSCVEILLTGDDENLGVSEPRGKVVVRGPAVCGGEVKLDLVGQIGSDHTLSTI